MELSPRKQAVLKAIVQAYIETGEPIGSKNLMAMLDNAPSSATLRNEMSELCELGLLHQPHTSAGRIPTVVGYKIYVDNLMSKSRLLQSTVDFIDNAFSGFNCEPEGIPAFAAQIITHLTGLPAIACVLTEKPPRIKRIELMPIGKASIMLLMITDDGRTRNRIFRQSKNFTQDALNRFNEIYEKYIKGKPVNHLSKAYMQNVIAGAGLYSLELMPLLASIFETASEIEQTDVTLQGENALYNISGNEDNARRILNLIKQRDPIIEILSGIEDNVGAVFGADTVFSELSQDAVVAAKFSVADKYKGYVGVIGPNRMSYEQIIPCIEYIAKILTGLMTEAQKDMED